MKTLSVMILLIFGAAAVGTAQTKEAVSSQNKYMVIAPHTEAQCLNILTDAQKKGDAYIEKFNWGCKAGNHVSYSVLEASSPEAVRKMLSTENQKEATVIPVATFTAAQVEMMRKDMAK